MYCETSQDDSTQLTWKCPCHPFLKETSSRGSRTCANPCLLRGSVFGPINNGELELSQKITKHKIVPPLLGVESGLMKRFLTFTSENRQNDNFPSVFTHSHLAPFGTPKWDSYFGMPVLWLKQNQRKVTSNPQYFTLPPIGGLVWCVKRKWSQIQIKTVNPNHQPKGT